MATPLTDTEVNTLGSQGYTEGSNVPGRGVLLPDGTFRQETSTPTPTKTITDNKDLNAGLSNMEGFSADSVVSSTAASPTKVSGTIVSSVPPNSTQKADGTYVDTQGNIYHRNDYNIGTSQYRTDYTMVPNPNLETETTTTDTTTGETITPEEQARKDNQLAMETAQKSFSDAITNIQNGTTPLSAGEQAQIDGLKKQFEGLIKEQQLINTGASGLANIRGYQTGAAEYDPTFQVKTIGSIVTAGMNKVADLQIKEASAVATLTQSIKDNNIKNIKMAYDSLNSLQKERAESIQKTIDEANTKIKETRDAAAKVTEGINKIAEEARKNGADAATVNKILASRSLGEAISNAGESLQTATGIVGEYKFYQKDALSKGLVPVDFNTYQNMDANRKKSIVAAGVAGTTSTGIPLKNLTESQAKDYTYARRGSNAMPIIDSLETTITSMNPLSYKTQISLESSVLGRNYASSEIKQIRQAERDFLTAVLRRESGASISPSEFAEGERVYFPIPGDDEKTLQQKKNSRETAIATFKSNVPQYQDRFANEPSNQLINIEQQADQKITSSLESFKTLNPILYKTVSDMYLSINPNSGQPYSATEILQAFPELNK